MTIGNLYSICLGLGVTFALLTTVLGWLFDHGGDVHVDATGHLDAGHPSPVSGTTIATFVTGFGAGGSLAEQVLGWSLLPGAILATASGMALAAVAYAALDFLFSRTQAGTEYTVDELVGKQAEVITPIAEGGVGEVAYVVRGQRERMSARTTDGSACAKGMLVSIESLAGATAYVAGKAPRSKEDEP